MSQTHPYREVHVQASQAHAPLPGTKPPPTGTGISGQQNADTTDVSTHVALHV
jgi:hypothetical protein